MFVISFVKIRFHEAAKYRELSGRTREQSLWFLSTKKLGFRSTKWIDARSGVCAHFLQTWSQWNSLCSDPTYLTRRLLNSLRICSRSISALWLLPLLFQIVNVPGWRRAAPRRVFSLFLLIAAGVSKYRFARSCVGGMVLVVVINFK